MELREPAASADYWRQVVEANPHRAQSHAFRAQALASAGSLPEAVESCRAALRLSPFEKATRMLLIDSLVRHGLPKEAQTELQALRLIRPDQAEQLQRWFEKLSP
jgi:predicted Zn-dependent protease